MAEVEEEVEVVDMVADKIILTANKLFNKITLERS